MSLFATGSAAHPTISVSYPGSVASYLIYADVRLHIPMTHHTPKVRRDERAVARRCSS